jgi:RHS repeat-associated protein
VWGRVERRVAGRAAAASVYDVRWDINADGAVTWADYNHYPDISMGRGVLSHVGNRFGYAGYQHAPELAGAKWHVRNRVLDSITGVWNRRDPLGYVDGMNLYQYVRGMALTQSDPSGLAATTSWGCCYVLSEDGPGAASCRGGTTSAKASSANLNEPFKINDCYTGCVERCPPSPLSEYIPCENGCRYGCNQSGDCSGWCSQTGPMGSPEYVSCMKACQGARTTCTSTECNPVTLNCKTACALQRLECRFNNGAVGTAGVGIGVLGFSLLCGPKGWALAACLAIGGVFVVTNPDPSGKCDVLYDYCTQYCDCMDDVCLGKKGPNYNCGRTADNGWPHYPMPDCP